MRFFTVITTQGEFKSGDVAVIRHVCQTLEEAREKAKKYESLGVQIHEVEGERKATEEERIL